jgi:glutamine amidotransferase-like uncharacterized protein
MYLTLCEGSYYEGNCNYFAKACSVILKQSQKLK